MFRRMLIVLYLTIISTYYSLPDNIVTISKISNSEFQIVVDAQSHIDYGFSFPLTYSFDLTGDHSNFTVTKRYSKLEEWEGLDSTELNYFNHHELYRIDSTENKILISLGFGSETDTIYVKGISDEGSMPEMNFSEITRFYDNRDAAMTASADDMAGWSQEKFKTTIGIFAGYQLYLTLGMNTNGMSSSTYEFVQKHINTGFIEAGAHSRTHPDWGDYGDYDSEITGCKNDIIDNLDMPALYRNGEHEYVYTYIAPNGYFDEIIDSLVGQNKMLVNRLYHDDFLDDFSEWNPESETYFPFTVTRAFDPPKSELGWGIGTNDSEDLNNKFDDVLEKGGVYHLMCHPNVMEWHKSYPWEHLDHISYRENVWYCTLGHLYVYHLAQTNYNYNNLVSVAENSEIPNDIILSQNYPNPFNPTTTIEYTIDAESLNRNGSKFVNLSVFDVLGRKIRTLVNGEHEPGSYFIEFDAATLNSGVYFYELRLGSTSIIKKMVYLK